MWQVMFTIYSKQQIFHGDIVLQNCCAGLTFGRYTVKVWSSKDNLLDS